MPQAIPIYVVNLARAPQRRARLTARLAELGLQAEFPPAMDAQEVSEQELMDGFTRWGPWGYLRNGDIACSQSHRALWSRQVQNGDPLVLILEDDVELSQDIASLCASDAWWPRGADIVKIERWKSGSMKIVIGKPVQGQAGPASLHRLISRHPGSAAYFISIEAADRLLRVRPQTVSIDQFLFNSETRTLPRDLTVLQSVPALAHQTLDDPEQMPGGSRPALPVLSKAVQETGRGLRGLWHGVRALCLIALGQARLLRLPLASDLARRLDLPEGWS